MEINALFNNICLELGLGNIVEKVQKLTGGYMHKMYRLQTDKGDFAIKLLNPVVMKRDDVFNNYKLADELEIKLQMANIPIVPALRFNEKKMQCVDNQYFYIFNFINGKALKSNQIQKEHCKIMGEILAKIHKIQINQETCNRDEMNIDWDLYIKLANEKCLEIVPLLTDNRDLLYISQNEGNNAYKKLPSITCICNGDMDTKNVLWVGNNPNVIDLECLNYWNPYMELFELALSWSGYEHCCINYELLETFISAYMQEYGKFVIDWSLLYYNNNDRLWWLEYNIKRALLIECENEDEQILGIEQVKKTIEQIVYYDTIRQTIITRLTKMFG